MVSSLLNVSLNKPSPTPTPTPLISATKTIIPSRQHKFNPIVSCRRKPESYNNGEVISHSKTRLIHVIFQKSVMPLAAASLAVVFWSNPAHAGFLSGSTGIESVPGPELPKFDFLSRFNEENQKKYAENDARFKDTPILKKLLEQSKLNKEKNKQETFDKYCIRGAEWGVGDCSTAGMSPDEREKFIAMLKQKAGVE